MNVHATASSVHLSAPPADLDRLAAEFERFRRETIDVSTCDDTQASDLTERMIALEEILSARWPSRWLLARRFGRRIRKSTAGYAWAGSSFRTRRIEDTGNAWLCNWDGPQRVNPDRRV